MLYNYIIHIVALSYCLCWIYDVCIRELRYQERTELPLIPLIESSVHVARITSNVCPKKKKAANVIDGNSLLDVDEIDDMTREGRSIVATLL